MNDHDVWYFTVETTISGERRGFSRQIKARPDPRRDIPVPVDDAARELLGEVVEASDVHLPDAVKAGLAYDYPYRIAWYALARNGVEVLRSFAIKPLKPCVDERIPT